MAGVLAATAYLDHGASGSLPVAHLYNAPIVLSALFFGYLGGVVAAVLAATAFVATHFVLTREAVGLAEADLLRFVIFLGVGLVVARLQADRRRIGALAGELAARNAELVAANRRLAELSAARADFVAVASHELRSPVAAVVGCAELLAAANGRDAERQARLTALARDAARRLQRTVENLLDTSLVDGGRLAVRPADVRLADMLAECAQAFAGIGAERLCLPEAPPDVVLRADPQRVLQVLTNLVGNALKFSPPDSPVALAVERRPDVLAVSVADQGYGIPADELPRVFERYYRATNGRLRAVRGVGLGLSVSREIARAHGGDLTVESAEGVGSTFTLTLPLRPPAEP